MKTTANSTRIRKTGDGEWQVERFSPFRRVEHILTILIFVTLVLTGFPQKFYESSWAMGLIDFFGGLDKTRTIHRWAGVAFALSAVVHLGGIAIGVATRKMRLTLMPAPQDLRDAWNNLLYLLGYRDHPPKFPKFDYRQKFEYVGLILGGLVMLVSGFVLLYPIEFASLAPGELIPASRVMHSNEAVLALLVLVVWHLYGSHFSPDVFPMDKSVFTGYMDVKDLGHHHKLEYERLFPAGPPGANGKSADVEALASAEDKEPEEQSEDPEGESIDLDDDSADVEENEKNVEGEAGDGEVALDTKVEPSAPADT